MYVLYQTINIVSISFSKINFLYLLSTLLIISLSTWSVTTYWVSVLSPVYSINFSLSWSCQIRPFETSFKYCCEKYTLKSDDCVYYLYERFFMEIWFWWKHEPWYIFVCRMETVPNECHKLFEESWNAPNAEGLFHLRK